MTLEEGESSRTAALRSPRIDSPIPDVVAHDPLSSLFARKVTDSTAGATTDTSTSGINSDLSVAETKNQGRKTDTSDDKPVQTKPPAEDRNGFPGAKRRSKRDLPIKYKLQVTFRNERKNRSHVIDVNFHKMDEEFKKQIKRDEKLKRRIRAAR
ncbi:MAG: hypothetical protein M1821_000528 [Bathelium mastoideum]|nr:MAG: hypothetical protein M1821_000528 [Bathelium mastoideum]KAI9682991.1 MAG: hypothetical protein M1822_006184 [Bathelium mastoideum]